MAVKEREQMNEVNMSKIEKRTDKIARNSGQVLNKYIEDSIKNVFIGALSCIEIRFGKDFEGYKEIRADILRKGNDSIRKLHEVIENRFNIEQIPNIVTVNFKKGE